MKRATDKQKNFLRALLRKTGDTRPMSWESLTKREAGKLIDKLLRKAQLQKPQSVAQAQFRLPDPNPEPPTELMEFKRWARGVYQRGEKGILELIEEQQKLFGNPFGC
jgi:hypothetical protein